MIRNKLQELLEIVGTEEKKAEKRMVETKNAANEIARTSANSPSQSGDREHSRNQAYLVEESYNNIKIFKEKLSKELLLEVPKKSRPICLIGIEYETGESMELVLANQTAFVEGFVVVTTASPLGRELVGKKVGDSFEFESGGGVRAKGVIKELE